MYTFKVNTNTNLSLFIWLFTQYQLYNYQSTIIDKYLSWENDYEQHHLRQGRRGGGGDGND